MTYGGVGAGQIVRIVLDSARIAKSIKAQADGLMLKVYRPAILMRSFRFRDDNLTL